MIRAQIGHDHWTEIRRTSGPRVVSEDIRLQGSSEAHETVDDLATHPFEISMRDPQFVKIGYARCHLSC